MTDLFAARSQMALSLAFHILFAVVGIGMPLLMVAAERRWLAKGDPLDLELAKRWCRGTAILFAVGRRLRHRAQLRAWPALARIHGTGRTHHRHAVLPRGLRLLHRSHLPRDLSVWVGSDPPRAHLFAGVLVAASGALSGVFVVIANAWMNTPTGFDLVDGVPVNIDPLRAILNPAAFQQTLHMTLAAYAATGFAVAGIHAFLLLRDPLNAFHRRALALGLLVGGPAALLQPLSGDLSARNVAAYQPAKLAAMEALFQTRPAAPLLLGGWPDLETRTVRFGIEIPYGLSLLAHHDPHAIVTGLDRIPRNEWPHVPTVHLAFQVMVGIGTLMAAVALWGLWSLFRRHDLGRRRPLLFVIAGCGPTGIRGDRSRLGGDRDRPAALGDSRRAPNQPGRHPHARTDLHPARLQPALPVPRRGGRLAAICPDHPQPATPGMVPHLCTPDAGVRVTTRLVSPQQAAADA